MRLSRVRFEDGKMISSALGSWHQIYLPVEGTQFRAEHMDAPPAPGSHGCVGKAQRRGSIHPNRFGNYHEEDSGVVRDRSDRRILVAGFVVLSIISIVLYAPFWMIGGLIHSRRRPAERAAALVATNCGLESACLRCDLYPVQRRPD